MNSKPSREAVDSHPSDYIIIGRQKADIRNRDEFWMYLTTFQELYGGSGNCGSECTTSSGNDWQLQKTVYANGEFDIKLRYRLACNSDVDVTLFEQENAQLFFDNVIDVVETPSTVATPNASLVIGAMKGGGIISNADINFKLGSDTYTNTIPTGETALQVATALGL